MLILAGDIGATNTRLLIANFEHKKKPKILVRKNYLGADYPSLCSIIKEFLTTTKQDPKHIQAACFAIAGPITNDKVTTTNIPWVIDAKVLRKELGIGQLTLINDFQAVGYGIETLTTKDLCTLQKGKSQQHGIKTIMGAGTGLGVGFMYFCNDHYVVSPTEGGHVNFSPNGDVQMGILKYLLYKYHRVSAERLLSGRGIENIYKYFRSLDDDQENPNLRIAIHRGDDAAATITEYALKHQDPLAVKTVDTFVRIYGSQAGDLAYTFLPYGGFYIAGGIAPKLIEQFTDGRFMQAFTDKGRLFRLLKNVPVHVILNPDVGLQGAAMYGYQLTVTPKNK